MILYRPVGLQELELIYDNGMKSFPVHLPQQPIFYPVLDVEYARQVATEWNAESEQFAGYITQFKVEDEYISRFEKHTVGKSQHQEFWIPAEDMEEFNQHIVGHIKVVEAHFEDAFQGFIPDQFGLQGKNAVEQFTLLSNSYIYKRMDFYLEIKRNHKAVFLNYPFWQEYDFKNPGLKEKILRAIKEAWFTSFPKIPLPNPVPEDTKIVKETDAPPLENPAGEDMVRGEKRDSQSSQQSVHKDVTPIKPVTLPSFVNPVHAEPKPIEQTDSHFLESPAREQTSFVKQADSDPGNIAPPQQTESHFAQGIQLGLSRKYREAKDELSKVVVQDPNHVVARTSLGVAFHRLAEDDRALSCYEAALKTDPKCAEAHYFRANILYGRGDVREAIAGYTTAIGLDPELIDAHERPVPQDRLTDYTRAPAEIYRIARAAHRILDLNRLIESNPRQAQLFKERAAQYDRLWNYEQAIADYIAALKFEPNEASVLHSRGLAYEQMGQFDRALEDYQRAIAIDPQLSNVYINRGVTFGRMGNFRQSIASLTEAIRLVPKSPDAYFNRGTSYFQVGDLERAIDDFSMVIQLSSDDEDAYYWRGISNEEAGRQSEAIADYRQFLTLSQNPRARKEIEQRLSQWNEETGNRVSTQSVVPDDSQKTNDGLDLYAIIAALGERALNSTWLGSGVECYGEKAKELYTFTGNNKPIEGSDFLRITSGIRQTIQGDFHAFDKGAGIHWLFIRAWNGNGFYIEINDPKSKERLKASLQSVDEVEGASRPYESLFIQT